MSPAFEIAFAPELSSTEPATGSTGLVSNSTVSSAVNRTACEAAVPTAVPVSLTSLRTPKPVSLRLVMWVGAWSPSQRTPTLLPASLNASPTIVWSLLMANPREKSEPARFASWWAWKWSPWRSHKTVNWGRAVVPGRLTPTTSPESLIPRALLPAEVSGVLSTSMV